MIDTKAEAKKALNTPGTNVAAKKVRTQEQKDAQKKADEDRKKLRKESFDKIMAFVKESIAKEPAKATPELKAAIVAMAPMRRSEGIVRDNVQDILARLFTARESANGTDVYNFEKRGWGRSDMCRNMALSLKAGDPEKRIWIEYDGKSDTYTVKGRGKMPPAGWLGYTPVDVAAPSTGTVPKA